MITGVWPATSIQLVNFLGHQLASLFQADEAKMLLLPPAFKRNLSQGTDRRSRSPAFTQGVAANHGKSATEAPKATPVKLSLSQSDDHGREQTRTFSFGTRKEQDRQLDPTAKVSLDEFKTKAPSGICRYNQTNATAKLSG